MAPTCHPDSGDTKTLSGLTGAGISVDSLGEQALGLLQRYGGNENHRTGLPVLNEMAPPQRHLRYGKTAETALQGAYQIGM